MDIQQIKQRFGIIGDSPLLNRALDTARQVAPTDISVLVSGESGTGKEIMPQVIHQLSARKHNAYIAVNCGAIPEGTIDSELFGHEKGSFTGAHEKRKGYFEEADGGTIFLDEVAELPLPTQVRLLRVLETGEYIKVGASREQKTDVRIIAATNVNIQEAIKEGKFREDLYYRLNTVPIYLPPLRQRKEDIYLLFRKFAADFAERYKMPPIRLTGEARTILEGFKWPGNVRQLKNIAEQISVIEKERELDAERLKSYLPDFDKRDLPAIVPKKEQSGNNFTERELLYKVLFEMRQDISDLKSIVLELVQSRDSSLPAGNAAALKRLYDEASEVHFNRPSSTPSKSNEEISYEANKPEGYDEHEEVEETLSLEDSERELIQKALKKHENRRKQAAKELGISERTLYRKIKEYDLK